MRTAILFLLVAACGKEEPLQIIHPNLTYVHVNDFEFQRGGMDFRSAITELNKRTVRPFVNLYDEPASPENADLYNHHMVYVQFCDVIDNGDADGIASGIGVDHGDICLLRNLTDDEYLIVGLHEMGHILGLPHQPRGIMCGKPYQCNPIDHEDIDREFSEFANELQ
jgi:hypothetical protein